MHYSLLCRVSLVIASLKKLIEHNSVGTYISGRPVVTIAKFSMTLAVFITKQRPRKLSLTGSDNREYQYLLKGLLYNLKVTFPDASQVTRIYDKMSERCNYSGLSTLY